MSKYNTYRLSPDTTPEAEQVVFALLSRKSPAEKLRIVQQISATTRSLALSGLRERHKTEPNDQLKVRLAQLLYGEHATSGIGNSDLMNEEPIDVALLVITVFEQLNIKYLIGGSLASAIHGEPRSTLDIDLLADIEPEQVDEFCRLIAPSFYIARESIDEALERRTSFNVIHLESVFKIDIFLPKKRDFEKREFERSELIVVRPEPERKVFVASPEDIILAKLEWYRIGNEISDRQWRDIVGIFKVKRDQLDIDYMRGMAVKLRVRDLLERLVD